MWFLIIVDLRTIGTRCFIEANYIAAKSLFFPSPFSTVFHFFVKEYLQQNQTKIGVRTKRWICMEKVSDLHPFYVCFSNFVFILSPNNKTNHNEICPIPLERVTVSHLPQTDVIVVYLDRMTLTHCLPWTEWPHLLPFPLNRMINKSTIGGHDQ